MYRQQGIKVLLEKVCPGRVKQREPLGPYTTIQIGGKADWLIQPQNLSEMKLLMELVRTHHIPWFVLGQGSNLLVSDRGVRGLVIHLSSPRLPIKTKHLKNGRVLLEIEAGVPLARLVRLGIKSEIEGLEFLAGIPGSIGGAWAMNAGSYGREIKDITAYLKIISGEGRLVRKGERQLSFSYRTLRLEPGEIILSGGLKVPSGEGRTIRKETRRLWSQRRTSQPIGQPSCGSVFKNPPGNFAGKLIEEAGLKGIARGKAQISSRHANFIINQGGAKAKDVLSLMNLIRTRVRHHFGILLEPEVRLWGCALKEIE
ncbi:MAG: UDP-N-acetylenolpyruvoylglucosamine reductase [Desulfobacca sp.]|nr:UDP-N-acetylenolpyruvoylglucosamine reductase [Desulfobacca sp.]